MTEYVVSPERARQLANLRDGGEFTATPACPKCGVIDIHPIRNPNREAPRLVRKSDGTTTQISVFGGSVIREWPDPDVYDRWDERLYETIRTCTGCNWEWGHR